MNKIEFVKRVLIRAGLVYLFAAPTLSFGQSVPPGAVRPSPPRSASGRRRDSTPPPDLLAGLTLTDEQKAKVEQIREQTKTQLAAVAGDKSLSPETMDAMMRGYQRIENGKIFEVLTPEQQVDVRKRMAAWRAAARQPKNQSQQPPVPETAPQAK